MIMGNLEGLVNGTEQMVFDHEVTGSAVSSISTGNILNGDEDGWYTIIQIIVGGAASSYTLMRVNNDASAIYGKRGIYAQSSTVGNISGTELTSFELLGDDITVGQTSLSVYRLYAKTGAVRLLNGISVDEISGTSVKSVATIGQVYNETSTNVTSLNFVSATNGYGIGTRIIILKSNNFTNGTPCGTITTPKIAGAWTRVGSQVLSSPASSVTFSGLDGDTAVCYYCSFQQKASGNTGGIYTRLNADAGTNYGIQYLGAVSTTVPAGRATTEAGFFSGSALSGQYSSCNFLIFAKSGFIRPFIGTPNEKISGTTVDAIYAIGGAWNNTSSNITSLTIPCTTNNFDTGSQFDLYALYK